MEKKLFNQRDINKIFSHIPSKTLRWWGMMDLYGWISFCLDGRGEHHEYDLGNLYQIGIVEELASLNFSTDNISFIMLENFWSRNMDNPIGTIPSDKKGWPYVNTENLMDKNLIIIKNHIGRQSGEKSKEIHEFKSFLAKREDIASIIDSTKETIVIIDLSAIKEFVDKLIREV